MDKITLPPRTPEDILLGIFYFLPDNTKTFVHDREKTHGFFYNHKKDYSILKDIRFRLDGFP